MLECPTASLTTEIGSPFNKAFVSSREIFPPLLIAEIKSPKLSLTPLIEPSKFWKLTTLSFTY